MRATLDYDRPAWPGPTIFGDVLSSAKAESDDETATSLSAVAPILPRAARRAVKLDGTSTNRTADAANAALGQTIRNSRVGNRKIFQKSRLGADPRRASPLTRGPPPAPTGAADAPALDTGNSAGGGTRALPPSSASSAGHATNANGLPPSDRPDCNTATAGSGAGRTARSPSTGSGGASARKTGLALDQIVDHAQEDPRERELPKAKSRRGGLLLSGTLYACGLIRRPPSPPD